MKPNLTIARTCVLDIRRNLALARRSPCGNAKPVVRISSFDHKAIVDVVQVFGHKCISSHMRSGRSVVLSAYSPHACLQTYVFDTCLTMQRDSVACLSRSARDDI
jgi:hypothetical protein